MQWTSRDGKRNLKKIEKENVYYCMKGICRFKMMVQCSLI